MAGRSPQHHLGGLGNNLGHCFGAAALAPSIRMIQTGEDMGALCTSAPAMNG